MRLIDWDYTKKLLEEKLNIPGKIIDYIAVKDILQLCASGSSNENISRFTDADVRYVSKTILEFFKFPGWSVDCECNPYQIFKSCDNDWESFVKEIEILYPQYSITKIEQMFSICEIFIEIEEETEKYWV